MPLFSAAVGLRPVRPRDSTTPAALPRCLVWRLRRVWAITQKPSAFSIKWRRGSKPGSGSSSGNPSNAARGREADQLGARERRVPARARTTSASGSSSGRSTFIETWATPPPSSTPIARTPGRPCCSALAHERRDPAGVLDLRGGRELEVERDQRLARRDQGRPGARA